MVLEHKKIEFSGNIIFESITSDEPQSFNYFATNEACFVHVEQGSNTTFSSNNKAVVSQGNFTLTSSGNLIVKTVPNRDTGIHRTTIIHFPKEIISSAFSNQLPQYLSDCKNDSLTEIITAKPCVILGNYIDGINLYLENQHRFNSDILYVKIKEILLLLLQSKKAPEVSTLLRNLFAERTNTFKATIEAHLFNDITIDDLALLSNMSLSTFKRKFRMVYQDSPVHYMLSKKLTKAKSLLTASELSINEITDEIGFKSAHHFSKKFKERYGQSPSKYRMNHIDKKLTLIGG